jgi:sensor c-di-GMP phosphodiesterase-like protein
MTFPARRVWISAGVILVAALCGALVGYFLGRLLTLRSATDQLSREAAYAIQESVAYSRDAHEVLDAMNAAPKPFCSLADLQYLSRILYSSHFLKEIDRLHNNKILCSTSQGRADPEGTQLPKPDFTGIDGVKVYQNPPSFRLNYVTVTGLQDGDSLVILNPFISSLRASSHPHQMVTVIGPDQKTSGTSTKQIPGFTSQMLSRDSDFTLGDTLYSTRCSQQYFTCVTLYISTKEALQADPLLQHGNLLLGAGAGALLGLLLSMVHRRSRDMGNQLRRAIRADKLDIVYQPIVEMATGRILGAEALARWTDDHGFQVSPEIFVRVAEERGFVGELTSLVLRRAVRDFAEILRSRQAFHISVNVAASDLSDPTFLPSLDAVLTRAGVSAPSVAIEITERSTARKQDARDSINHLRQRGHSVQIDDFGTGYSSLSYLQELAIDAIKIDRAFTQTIGTESVTSGILPQILAMAEALNLQVIVEGVETEQQAEYFTGPLKARSAQGWLYGRPISAAKFRQLLTEEHERIGLANNQK